MTVILESIKRKVMDDENPDLSYLEQNYDNLTPELNKEYKAHDKYRRECYGLQWHMKGIRAIAQIRVNGVSHEITSAGLWGIESDSGESHFDEVYQEELTELREMLLELGITQDNINKVNGL